MSLSDLPDDILGLISCLLNGFDNCSLWMASDSKMRERLVNNVITDFHIKYKIPARYLWPGNFLKKLQRLSRLSLVVAEDVYHLPIENVELFPISTLQYLNLQFNNLKQLLEHQNSTSSSYATGPTTSSSDPYINLNDYYCNLEYFEFRVDSFGSFKLDFLACLPRKLKSLCSRNYLELNNRLSRECYEAHFASLPRTLTDLDISFSGDHEKAFHALFARTPPNLTRLAPHCIIDPLTYSKAPQSIEILDAGAKKIEVEKFLLIGASKLRDLYVDYSLAHLGHILKDLQNLESLVLDASKHPTLDTLIPKCPPNLKNLNCYSFNLSSVPNGFFGNKLTTLLLSGGIGMTRQFVSSLPKSLRNLTYIASTDHEPFFELLPRNLTSFTWNAHINEKLSLLPQSLTYLRLTPQGTFCEAELFDQLPQNLEKFIYKSVSFPESLLKNLPKTLKNLDLFSPKLIFDDNIVRLLPRGLKKLCLRVDDKLTDSSVGDLPPNLKLLTLNNNTGITDDGIQSLPRSLMFLDLPKNRNFTDKCIKHLPRNLIKLSFNESTGITSNSCKDLPKYLKGLILTKCKQWEEEIVPILPPHLAALDTGNQKLRSAWTKFKYCQPQILK